MTTGDEKRFWSKVDKSGECWLWMGTKSRGYGQFYLYGRGWPAHRLAYELVIAPIPEGLQLDHLCRVRHCVNPDHLEAVTNKVNCLRGVSPWAVNARKTDCPQGHPYSGENLYTAPSGARYCRTCNRKQTRERSRERYATDAAYRESCREATARYNAKKKLPVETKED
jgi:hypothetical protein